MLLHRGLTLFPTGTAILNECEAVRGQRLADEEHGVNLAAAYKPDLHVSTVANVLQLRDKKAWKAYTLKHAGFLTKTSKAFQDTNKVALEAMSAHIESASDALNSAFTAQFDAKLERILPKLVGCINRTSTNALEEFKDIQVELVSFADKLGPASSTGADHLSLKAVATHDANVVAMKTWLD